MKPLHLAIGIFDGVHCGHRYLIGEAVHKAQATQALSGVLTFHPHPKQVLNLPDAPKLIYPIQQRYWLLKKLGCDYVFIKNFTEAWSRSKPEKFFQYLRRLFPNLCGLYVGEDFHFGHNRCGNTETLRCLCEKDGQVHLHVFEHLQHANERICSTRVRNSIRQGNLILANQLLKIPYHFIGVIIDNTFKHHCELKLKDGRYRCMLKNKAGQQSLDVTIETGCVRCLQEPDACFKNKASILEFVANQ